MIFKSLLTAFHIFIYKGSNIPSENYIPLINSLHQTNKNITNIEFMPYSFLKTNKFQKESVLIGHSFGGYFALKDAIEDKRNGNHCVRSVVLLNSHMNSRKQVWYPQIKHDELGSLPILTLAGDQDQRLPLEWVLPDLWESRNSNLHKIRPYKIYPSHHHFSGLSPRKTLDTVKLACDISKFIVQPRNWSEPTYYSYKKTTEFLFPKGYDCSSTLSIFDSMLKLFWYNYFWSWTHFVYFLTLKPTLHSFPHYTYRDDILVKTQNLSFDSFCSQHKSLFWDQNGIKYQPIDLPTNLIGLYIWLLFSPKTQNKIINVFVLKLPEKKTYYKVCHPETFILKNRLHDKNPLRFWTG